MPTKRFAIPAILLLLLIGPLALAQAERPEPEVHGEFQGDKMYTLLPPDGIPAIMEPEYLSGDEAAAQMSPVEKNTISHRGQAIRAMKQILLQEKLL